MSECLKDFLFNALYAVLGAIITWFFRKVSEAINKRLFKNKLLISKKEIEKDLSDIMCFMATPDIFDNEEQTNLGYTFEYMALGEINSLFRYVYNAKKSIPCKMARLDSENYFFELQNHLILIGGPNHNSVTKSLFFSEYVNYPFSFVNNNSLVYRKPGSSAIEKIYKSKTLKGSSGDFQNDYALILNVKNPRNKQKRIILICGCRSIGCYGGAVFFSNHLKELKNIVRDPEYALVIECAGNNEGLIHEPKLVDYYPL